MASSEEYDDDEWGDDDEDSSSSDEDESNNSSKRRSLLWLCEEGQVRRALEHYHHRIKDNNDQELFQTNADGNSVLHELLMGGTQDSSAKELSQLLVHRYHSLVYYPRSDDEDNDDNQQKLLTRQKTLQLFSSAPRSHRRTLLHWAAWGKASAELVRTIVQIHPESICRRDKPDKGGRTPLELAQRYWPNDPMTQVLQNLQHKYLPIRIQTTVHLCVVRWFASPSSSSSAAAAASFQQQPPLTPFDKQHRKEIAKLSPRAWFVASVLGYCLQRELKGLMLHILGFVGHKAQLEKKATKKRKKNAKTTTKRKRQDADSD